MSSQMPPVPPAGRSDKGPGGAPDPAAGSDAATSTPTAGNLAEQDRQGNVKQNTTNQGYQQDR